MVSSGSFGTLLLLAAGMGLLLLGEARQRAILREIRDTVARWAEEDLRRREEAEEMTQEQAQDLLEKVLAALLREPRVPLQRERTRVVEDPAPAVLATGEDFRQFVFSPLGPRVLRRLVTPEGPRHLWRAERLLLGPQPRRAKALRVDIATAWPGVARQLCRAWEALGGRTELPPNAPAAWWLYLVSPAPAGRNRLAKVGEIMYILRRNLPGLQRKISRR